MLLRGWRMPRPSEVPIQVYAMMRSCWHKEPRDRPSFREILEDLEAMSALHGELSVDAEGYVCDAMRVRLQWRSPAFVLREKDAKGADMEPQQSSDA